MAINADTPGELSRPDGASDDTATADGHTDDFIDYGKSAVDGSATAPRGVLSSLLLAGVAGLIAVVAVGTLSVWLGCRAHESQQIEAERQLYLQVACQGALDLTTIDYRHAQADSRRILDTATGQFHDEFSQRVEPFVDVVEKSKSSSQGTVTEPGLDSVAGDEAQATVAVSVHTTVPGSLKPVPRSWRMHLTLQKLSSDVKISNVGFVP